MPIDPRTVAPLVSVGATWLVRRQINRAYQRRTGDASPRTTDLDTPLARVLVWAAVAALTSAVIDVLILRGAAELARRQEMRAALQED